MTMTDAVTGAFSYTGRHLARRLIEDGRVVRTLTNHSGGGGRSTQIEMYPLRFEDTDSLARSLRGVDTLYNTYWVRFVHGTTTFDRAVTNTETLIAAAARAEVRRIVHVSIANVENGSGLPYFEGKAACERAVQMSGCSYAIVRPTVLFGGADVFISNLAWLLRRFPVLAVAGDGRYKIQPVHVEDHARLMAEAGGRNVNEIFDSAGPDAFTFDEFVREIAHAVGRKARIVHVPSSVFMLTSRLIGNLVRDVVLNREELDGLMRGLMHSDEPARGKVAFTDWLRSDPGELGRKYVSEIKRHYM